MSTNRYLHSAQQWGRDGEQLNLGGEHIFVRHHRHPGKPVLLLLHGFPSSSWDWQPLWEPLGEHFELLALDLLGFGFSAKPNRRDYSIHRQADIVEALVAAKQIDHCQLLVHDYSVSVAQELLARQQQRGDSRYRSCCFLNGGLFPETHRALLTQRLLLSPLGGLLNSLAGYRQFARNFSRVFGQASQPSEEELRAHWWLITRDGGKHLFHNLITYINDRRQHRQRWLTPLQQSAIPLALINGSCDPVSGQHMVVRYQQLGCRLDYLAQLPMIGHYPQLEDSEAVLEHYLAFALGHH